MLALVVQFARMGMIWMLVQALGLDVPGGVQVRGAAAGPVLFAALSLPVSLNGIGVREAVFVYFLRDSTTERREAIALGVAFFAVGPRRRWSARWSCGLRFVRYGAEAVRPRTQIEE